MKHLTERGVMGASLFYEPPFTDLTLRGPKGLLGSAQVSGLVDVLEGVRRSEAETD